MKIACPHCSFSREVDNKDLPDKPKLNITCPKCKEKFSIVIQTEADPKPSPESKRPSRIILGLSITSLAIVLIISSIYFLPLLQPENKPAKTEKYLSCKATYVSPLSGPHVSTFGFTITKSDDTIIKVKSAFGREYTLNGLVVEEEGKKRTNKLIIDKQGIKLHSLAEGAERPLETIIDNSGDFNRSSYLGWYEGSCKVSEKVL
jgi:hypothetical protein